MEYITKTTRAESEDLYTDMTLPLKQPQGMATASLSTLNNQLQRTETSGAHNQGMV